MRQAFSDEKVLPHAQEYLQTFLSNMKDEAEAQRRSITFAFLVVITFELLRRNLDAGLAEGQLPRSGTVQISSYFRTL